jgi:hypothetical protein
MFDSFKVWVLLLNSFYNWGHFKNLNHMLLNFEIYIYMLLQNQNKTQIQDRRFSTLIKWVKSNYKADSVSVILMFVVHIFLIRVFLFKYQILPIKLKFTCIAFLLYCLFLFIVFCFVLFWFFLLCFIHSSRSCLIMVNHF